MGLIASDLQRQWKYGYIPYEIHPGDFPIGSANRAIVERAIAIWNAQSDLKLRPRQGESDYVLYQRGNPGCNSPVGRQGGCQIVSCAVGPSFGFGNVLHETGHAAGLIHEHQRSDRGAFVNVTGTDRNYSIRNETIVGPYDCCSLMHYPPNANISSTAAACASMGQRTRLSEGDRAALRVGHPLVDVTTLGDTTDLRVSLAFHDGRLFVAWRGSGNDNLNLIFSADGGRTFSGKVIFGETSSHAPAITSHNGLLLMAWKGSGNEQINIARVTLGPPDDFRILGLGPVVTLPESTDFSPAITSHQGQLVLAWRGSGNDQLNLAVSSDNGATFGGKATLSESSDDAPAIISHNGKLLLAWRGSGNEQINVATVTQGPPPDNPITGIVDKVVLGDESDFSPALASRLGVLYLAWCGLDENLNILASLDDGATFVDKRVSVHTSTDAPALATGPDGQVMMGWKGSGNEEFNVARVSLFAVPELCGADHAGNYYQSTFGESGNYELFVVKAGKLVHLVRLNDTPAGPTWVEPPLQPAMNAAATARGAAAFQSRFRGDGVHGNHELLSVVTQRSGTLLSSALMHWFFDSRLFQWFGPFQVVADGQPVTGVTGTPAVLQGDWHGPGAFELLVPIGGQLVHFYRDHSSPAYIWHRNGAQPSMSVGSTVHIPLAVTLIASSFTADENRNLEAIVWLRPTGAATGGILAHYFYNGRRWEGPFPLVTSTGTPINNVSGNPALIQVSWSSSGSANYGALGHFHLVVPQGTPTLGHYIRDNDAPGFPWTAFATPPVIGADRSRVPSHVALFQSNFRSNCRDGDLELIVRTVPIGTPDAVDGDLQRWTFDSLNEIWTGPLPLQFADGSNLAPVEPF
jgi:hypothetical protein